MIARLLVAGEPFQGDAVEVIDDDYRHLFRSLRLRSDDALEVTNGAGEKRRGVVTSITKRSGTIALEEALEPPAVRAHVCVYSCAPRPERAAWLVEKCTELGVREFCFFDAENSARSISVKGLQRLERVAKSAILQCGGAWLPRFESVGGFEAAIETLGTRLKSSVICVLEPGAPRSLNQVQVGDGSNVVLVLGPEGGLTQQEVTRLASVGAEPVALGASLLRMETAAVSAVALLLARQ